MVGEVGGKFSRRGRGLFSWGGGGTFRYSTSPVFFFLSFFALIFIKMVLGSSSRLKGLFRVLVRDSIGTLPSP